MVDVASLKAQAEAVLAPLLEKASPALDAVRPHINAAVSEASRAWAAVEPHARVATQAVDAKVGHLAPWQVAAGSAALVALFMGAAGHAARRLTVLGVLAVAAANWFGVKLD